MTDLSDAALEKRARNLLDDMLGSMNGSNRDANTKFVSTLLRAVRDGAIDACADFADHPDTDLLRPSFGYQLRKLKSPPPPAPEKEG